MKSSYATPAVVGYGDVVRNTRSAKQLNETEVGISFRPPAGVNLSFGL